MKMNKKIIIHPCRNQNEVLKIALDCIGENPKIKCKGIGHANSIAIANPSKKYEFVCTVMETKSSIIFRGRDD